MISAVGDSQVVDTAAAGPEDVLPSLAVHYLGRVGADLVAILFVTSTFAASLTFHNVIARYLFAMSSQQLLPRALSVTHATHGSPHVGSIATALGIFVGVGSAVVIGLDPIAELYTWTAALGSVGYVVLLVVTCLAVLQFFRRPPENPSAARTLIAPLLGLAGLLAFLAMMVLNLDLLTGDNRTMSVAIVVSLLCAYAVGLVIGRRVEDAGRE